MRVIYSAIRFLAIMAICDSCKTEAPPLPPDNSNRFEILWKTPITYGPGVLGLNPILYDSLVIVNTEYELYDDFAAILFIDTTNGAVVDTWSDYIDGTTLYTSNKFYHEDDYLVLHTMRSTDVLNLKTRQRQWASTTNRNQSAFLNGDSGYIYTSHNIGTKTATVERTPIHQENWETVYSFTANGAMRPFFDGFGFASLPNGDQILLWQNRVSFPTSQLEIFAFNLTADTLLWRNRDFPGFELLFPPLVYQGKVYGPFIDSIYCLDLETGQTLWLKNIEPSFGPSFEPFGIVYMGIYNNQLLIKSNRSGMLYATTKTGSVNKVVEGYPEGNGEGEFSYWQGKLYFNSGLELAVTDIATGENLVTPANLGELADIDIYSSITVDPDNGKLYFQDGYFLYCVRQPKNL